jgi:NADPH:quinone reductase-like Zn-dependent oxidoreductase
MRAAVLHAHGDPAGFVEQDWPDPVPRPGEVLVRVEAVCVNRTDVHVLERTNIGRFVKLPHVGGLDPAGTVVAVGPDVTEPRPGSRVVARPMIPCQMCRFCVSGRDSVCERPTYVGVHRPGGFAELVALPARAVYPIPDGLSAAMAAVTAHSVPIALHLVETVGGVGPGDRVLVIGAGGGIGLVTVQLARWLGADVIAAVGDPTKGAPSAGEGVPVVSYADPAGLSAQVRALTDGFGATVAVDNVGSRELWPAVVASLDKGGRILSCGAHAGGLVELDLNLFYRQQLRLLATAGTTDEEFRRSLALVAEGSVRPRIHAEWPLAEIAEAFRELIARQNTGKVVIRVTRSPTRGLP